MVSQETQICEGSGTQTHLILHVGSFLFNSPAEFSLYIDFENQSA